MNRRLGNFNEEEYYQRTYNTKDLRNTVMMYVIYDVNDFQTLTMEWGCALSNDSESDVLNTFYGHLWRQSPKREYRLSAINTEDTNVGII